jgi:hypothetical protein
LREAKKAEVLRKRAVRTGNVWVFGILLDHLAENCGKPPPLYAFSGLTFSLQTVTYQQTKEINLFAFSSATNDVNTFHRSLPEKKQKESEVGARMKVLARPDPETFNQGLACSQ